MQDPTRIIVTAIGVCLGSLVIIKGIGWDRLLAPYMARLHFYSARSRWPWYRNLLKIPKEIGSTQGWGRRQARPYQYAPLIASRQIRLLEVSYGRDPKNFICELVPVSLDDLLIQYLAVSYTWGDPEHYSTVTFSNHEMLNITKSVSIILDTMFVKNKCIYVWIDSICINQNDIEERSIQIRLMNEIYSKAQQVLICLGESTLESNRAIDFIIPLRGATEEASRAAEDPSFVPHKLIFSKGGFDDSSSSWIALSNLLNRSWFTRIWVVQEVAVAINPIFICGNRAVAWDDLASVSYLIYEHSLIRYLQNDSNSLQSTISATKGLLSLTIMDCVRHAQQQGQPKTLQETLIQLHGFNATDPRDKIFALLGLAADTGEVILDPDYTALAEEVYTNTARYLLCRDACILILHKAGIGYPREYGDLPSWVPEWEYSTTETRMVLGAMEAMKYNAAGNTIATVRSVGNDIIIIDGIIVDTVKDLSSIRGGAGAALCVTEDHFREIAQSFLVWFEEIENLIKSVRSPSKHAADLYLGGTQTWKEAIWRTLVANNALYKPAPAEFGEYFELFKVLLRSVHTEGPSYLDRNQDLQKLSLFSRAFGFAAAHRRFFTTRNGYIGLTSPGSLPEDRVCIFLSGATPFIIRENASASIENGNRVWSLVGEAYVHGLMDGEALNMGKIEGIQLI